MKFEQAIEIVEYARITNGYQERVAIARVIADAIRESEKRGWNAAVQACAEMISDCGCVAVSANETIKAIRALEKP
mgnify:CR=1 FL=1